MRKLKVSKIWIPAFLLAVVMAGCGDPDPSKGGATSPLTPPTVVSVLPTAASTGVCQGTLVSATFSKAMNPATINTGTFKLAAGATAVTGTVALDSTELVATFTPTSPLTLNTQYTATITTNAQDQFGNGLALDFVWMFTTATTACQGPIALAPPGCGFGILAGSTVTNSPIITGTTTHVTGDVGVWPGTAITGFPPGTITGAFSTGPGPGAAMTAQGQLTTAYNTAAGAPGGAALTGDIGGQTLLPGVYKATTTLGITGNLTLDGNGDPNATWIFQVGSALTTAAGNSHVILINGANSHNVFWQIGSSATLGTNTIFQGTIMAQASITLTTGATLNGRALARTGAVTLDSNAVNVPPCP
jgi:ice-binding like protein/Big-like domain-containing protein